MRLALKMLARDWRGGEIQLLFACLILAVATVSGITHFSSTLQASLLQQSKDFLAGSMVLTSPRTIDAEWFSEAEKRNIQFSQTVSTASMVFANNKMQLSSIKAVGEGYPLRGKLLIANLPFSSDGFEAKATPKPGEAWLASSMANLLDISPGDRFELGNIELTFSQVIIDEPDRGFAMFSVGPRVMINLVDLEKADLIHPGSRVTFNVQFDSTDEQIKQYKTWLEPKLGSSVNLRTLDDAQPRLSEALKRAERFLLLAGSLAVMLSGLAIAMSAQRYCQRHYDHVAILKTLGMTEGRVLWLFATSLMILAFLASFVGAGLGWILKNLFEIVFKEYLVEIVEVALWRPWLFGLATALVSLVAFAWPPLRTLQKTSAMAVLRDLIPADPLSQWLRVFLASLGCVALLMIYTSSWFLSLGLLAGIVALAIVVGVFANVLLALPRGVSALASPIGLAWANLLRHRKHTQLQLMVYSSALMLVGLLWAVRTDLIADWRAALPENTPNHFLVNVSPAEVEPLRKNLQELGIATEQLYPMVRGRLTHINGENVRTQVTKENQRSIDRELNLTWRDDLPFKNILEQGDWWRNDGSDGVSIESRLAERIGVKLGDALRFQIGADVVDTYVQSIRSLDWQQMRPNFYVIFPPQALESYPATYITSVYLNSSQKAFLVELMRAFPTVTIIEMDVIINQINSTVDRVSQAIEIVFVLVLLATAAVLIASILSSQRERRRDNALLRVLGATSPLLWRACGWEFVMLGLSANLIACLGAELSLALIQTRLLDIAPSIHPQLWLALPAISIPVLVFIGIASSRPSLYEPPIVLLRDN